MRPNAICYLILKITLADEENNEMYVYVLWVAE